MGSLSFLFCHVTFVNAKKLAVYLGIFTDPGTIEIKLCLRVKAERLERPASEAHSYSSRPEAVGSGVKSQCRSPELGKGARWAAGILPNGDPPARFPGVCPWEGARGPYSSGCSALGTQLGPPLGHSAPGVGSDNSTGLASESELVQCHGPPASPTAGD